MRCDEFRERMTSWREGLADGADAASMQEHAARCAACRSILDEESNMSERLNDSGRAFRERSMTDAVLERIAANAEPRTIRVPWWSRGVIRFTAAAVLVVAAGVLVIALPLGGATNTAWAAAAQRLRQADTIRFRIYSPDGSTIEAGRITSATVYLSGTKYRRVELSDGRAVISNAERGEVVSLVPSRKFVVQGVSEALSFDVREMLVSLADSPDVEHVGVDDLNGEPAMAFTAPAPEMFDEIRGERIKVWIDPHTRLPLRMQYPVDASTPKVVAEDFVFDEPIPDELFDTRPEGYTEGPLMLDRVAAQMKIATTMRNIAMAVHLFMSEHQGATPTSLDELSRYGITSKELASVRDPSLEGGYVYRRPVLPLKYDDVVVYENMTSWQGWAAYAKVDGSVHFTEDKGEYERLTGTTGP
jgi:outer membrane lipoprotein-sorting protein